MIFSSVGTAYEVDRMAELRDQLADDDHDEAAFKAASEDGASGVKRKRREECFSEGEGNETCSC